MRKLTKGVAICGVIAVSLTLFANAQVASAEDSNAIWATNSSAAKEPAKWDRMIRELAVNKGELYSGYGNYSANIGPIDVISHNLQTGAETNHLTMDGEEINTFQEINGDLYIPNIDPKAPWEADVGYASNKGGAWANYNQTPFIHIFDVASTGDDLWLSGSIANPDKAKYGNTNYLAAVKRSVDGGATWTIEKATASTNINNGFERYYWIEEVEGKIYTSAYVSYRTTTLEVWDNGVWSEVRIDRFMSLLEGRQVESIKDKIVFWSPTERFVYNTKTKTTDVITVDANDMFYEKETDTLYGVSDTTLYYTKDAVNWSVDSSFTSSFIPDEITTAPNGTQTNTPRSVTSLAVADGNAYYGTNSGDIFKKALNESAPEEPVVTPTPTPTPVEKTVEIKAPSSTITLKDLAKPLNGVTAVASDGAVLTNSVKHKVKSNLRGTVVEYTVAYEGKTTTMTRAVQF